jgi:hypothetical protein
VSTVTLTAGIPETKWAYREAYVVVQRSTQNLGHYAIFRGVESYNRPRAVLDDGEADRIDDVVWGPTRFTAAQALTIEALRQAPGQTLPEPPLPLQ